jgi:hypothetical protein
MAEQVNLVIRAKMMIDGLGGPPITQGLVAIAGNKIVYVGATANAPEFSGTHIKFFLTWQKNWIYSKISTRTHFEPPETLLPSYDEFIISRIAVGTCHLDAAYFINCVQSNCYSLSLTEEE